MRNLFIHLERTDRLTKEDIDIKFVPISLKYLVEEANEVTISLEGLRLFSNWGRFYDCKERLLDIKVLCGLYKKNKRGSSWKPIF